MVEALRVEGGAEELAREREASGELDRIPLPIVPKGYPADAEGRMAKVDFDKMADDRARVLAEWSKRYESKAAPKN